jgi:hypothetical protein
LTCPFIEYWVKVSLSEYSCLPILDYISAQPIGSTT